MMTPSRLAKQIAFTALLFPLWLHGEGFEEVLTQTEKNLETAVAEHKELLQKIAAEKIPLVREVNTLEDQIIEKSKEVARRQRIRDNRSTDLETLRRSIKSSKDENDYMAGLLDEFVRSFESRLHPSEVPFYGKPLKEARLALEDVNLSTAEQLKEQLQAVEVAFQRLEKIIGGNRFEGKALTPEGVLEKGQFARLGPLVYFGSKESELAGIAELRINTIEPAVVDLGPEAALGIQALLSENAGLVPVDPTLGKAIKIEEAKDSFRAHIEKGRAVGYAILLLGAVALLTGLFKVFEISRFRTPKPARIETILTYLGSGQKEKAEAAARSLGGAVGSMMVLGVTRANEKRRVLEELLLEQILKSRLTLERFLPFLALTAAATPLMGLLGTVMGMIRTFKLITIFGTGDAKSLSSGISEALVTTELGLIVAIPMLIFHGFLTRLARRKVSLMQQIAVAFLNREANRGLAKTTAPKSVTPKPVASPPVTPASE